MAGVGGWRWEVGGNYQPPEFWMPEHMADPDWNPFLRIVSAEQSSDKACFADIKKRNTHPLSMSGTSGSEINNETSPGKDRSIFSLLPFTPAAAGQPKGHPAVPISAATSHPSPAGPCRAGPQPHSAVLLAMAGALCAKYFTWIISLNPRPCLRDGQSYYFPRFLGLRF